MADQMKQTITKIKISVRCDKEINLESHNYSIFDKVIQVKILAIYYCVPILNTKLFIYFIDNKENKNVFNLNTLYHENKVSQITYYRKSSSNSKLGMKKIEHPI